LIKQLVAHLVEYWAALRKLAAKLQAKLQAKLRLSRLLSPASPKHCKARAVRSVKRLYRKQATRLRVR
jgi:hypothetical protein